MGESPQDSQTRLGETRPRGYEPMLQEMFGQISAATFIERYFHQLPIAVPAGAAHLASHGTIDLLRRIAEHPESLIHRSRHGVWWPDGARPAYDELLKSLDEGWTIFVRHAERYDEAISRLAAEFQAGFQAPIDVHFFCTPPATQGFGWHYDVEDVFILQTQGSKKYWLRKNTVNPWPLVETTPDDLSYKAERSLPMECTLRAGDWLYIPMGYWHATQADELSVSLSVGMMSTTALDLVDLLRPMLAESLRWRQRLPLLSELSAISPEKHASVLQPIFADLANDIARCMTSDAFVARYLEHKRSVGSQPGARLDMREDRESFPRENVT